MLINLKLEKSFIITLNITKALTLFAFYNCFYTKETRKVFFLLIF